MRFSLLIILCVAACALAKPKFLALVPNSNKVPGCTHLGHQGCKPPANNQFGKDFEAAGFNWTRAFCEKDSDGDGESNGLELGDPCCEWSTTNKKLRRTTKISHPGESAKTSGVSMPECPSPTADPMVQQANETADGAVCFPGDAGVRVRGVGRVPMSELRIGDAVEVAAGVFSPVFMFTHRLPNAQSTFVRVSSARGAVLHLSPGHFLYFGGRLAAASKLRVGDTIEVDGRPDTVIAVSRAVKRGLYNPQTAHGDIVVDRVRASTYTHVVPYTAGQAALAPLRALFAWFGFATSALERGVRDTFLPRAEL